MLRLLLLLGVHAEFVTTHAHLVFRKMNFLRCTKSRTRSGCVCKTVFTQWTLVVVVTFKLFRVERAKKHQRSVADVELHPCPQGSSWMGPGIVSILYAQTGNIRYAFVYLVRLFACERSERAAEAADTTCADQLMSTAFPRRLSC